ncbi:serine/threonine-protein kinase [Nocardia suismassiliense]|uniref:serine/threonine-protein kinase n=1 Tax=Nocardia suismassiliense TaxID=2077092 RepID=UPI000D1DF34D|nr:serine/threonine-protein kinase [Nocardia suismassiliense]
MEMDRVAATQTALTRLVAEFDSAWEDADEPPDLAAHLPAESGLRRSALIELIKVDLQHRWRETRTGKRLAEYRAQFPELDAAPLPPDLIYEEITARSRRGDDELDLTEYEQDFAAQMAQLATQLDIGSHSAENFRTTLLSDATTSNALDTIAPGATIDDFDLLIALGQGAFARVFLARQRSMQRLVAVKVSRDRGSEPQTLAQLDHEHIVRVFDQRQIEEQHLKLMYMQYVPGGTLLGVLRLVRSTPPAQRTGQLLLDAVDAAVTAGGVLTPQPSLTRADLAKLSWSETVAWLGSRLATALDYANRAGVLHRDIKPANVLLTADGHPKLADFNISFSTHIPGASPVAYFGGSLAYMSPEQLEACHPTIPTTAADLDTRSDLYALAVVLWELLTGRLPFTDELGLAESDTSLTRMIELRRQPIDERLAATAPPDCPQILRHALLSCLSPDRDDRYASGADLAQHLELTLDRTARDLVDPPSHSLRGRLRMRPMPVVTLSSALGQLLGVLYLSAHNTKLLDMELGVDGQAQLTKLGLIAGAVGYPVGVAILLYWCRLVFLVPYGLRHGKHYDEQTLAKARADTLACSDRIAAVSFAGWALALLVFLIKLHDIADLSAGLLFNLIASHFVAAAVAVVYTYFPVTFFVLRWYYPGLVAAGHSSPSESSQLRRLARRSRIYLGIAASVPLFGVAAGVAFLHPTQQQTVLASIVGLCVGGLFAFLGTLRVFYTLDSDLHALDRIVDPHARP